MTKKTYTTKEEIRNCPDGAYHLYYGSEHAYKAIIGSVRDRRWIYEPSIKEVIDLERFMDEWCLKKLELIEMQDEQPEEKVKVAIALTSSNQGENEILRRLYKVELQLKDLKPQLITEAIGLVQNGTIQIYEILDIFKEKIESLEKALKK